MRKIAHHIRNLKTQYAGAFRQGQIDYHLRKRLNPYPLSKFFMWHGWNRGYDKAHRNLLIKIRTSLYGK